MMNHASSATQETSNDLIQADIAVKEAEDNVTAANATLKSRKEHRENMRTRLRETQLPLLIAQFKALGVSVSDLGLPKKSKGSTPSALPLPPKYRDPVTGKEWSGRGNKPKWVKGQDLGDQSPLLISNQTTHIEA